MGPSYSDQATSKVIKDPLAHWAAERVLIEEAETSQAVFILLLHLISWLWNI